MRANAADSANHKSQDQQTSVTQLVSCFSATHFNSCGSCMKIFLQIEQSRVNGPLADVTGSAGVTGRQLTNAIISDKSK